MISMITHRFLLYYVYSHNRNPPDEIRKLFFLWKVNFAANTHPNEILMSRPNTFLRGSHRGIHIKPER